MMTVTDENGAVARFTAERIRFDEAGWTSLEEVWTAWLGWCVDREEVARDERWFHRALTASAGGRLIRHRIGSSTGYRGITLGEAPEWLRALIKKDKSLARTITRTPSPEDVRRAFEEFQRQAAHLR